MSIELVMNKELKITLLLSLIGILLLIFIASQISTKKVDIGDITEKDLGHNVKIEAKIVGLREFPEKSFQILTLEDSSGQMTATSNSDTMLNLSKNQDYLFVGKIQNYNQTLQLQLDIIKRVN